MTHLAFRFPDKKEYIIVKITFEDGRKIRWRVRRMVDDRRYIPLSPLYRSPQEADRFIDRIKNGTLSFQEKEHIKQAEIAFAMRFLR